MKSPKQALLQQVKHLPEYSEVKQQAGKLPKDFLRRLVSNADGLSKHPAQHMSLQECQRTMSNAALTGAGHQKATGSILCMAE